MKKIKFKIIWFLVWIFILSGLVYAWEWHITRRNELQSIAQYHRINNGSYKSIDKWIYCRKVTNSSWNDLFIPTKTNAEWYSFINNKPSWVSISTECYIEATWTDDSNSSASWVHTKPNSDHIDVCFQWKCTNWYSDTFNIADHIYFRWYWSRFHDWDSTNYTHKRWSFHHSNYDTDGIRKYYYIIEK